MLIVIVRCSVATLIDMSQSGRLGENRNQFIYGFCLELPEIDDMVAVA